MLLLTNLPSSSNKYFFSLISNIPSLAIIPSLKKYNVSHLVGKGVFSKLNDLDFYMNNCTVLNGTLAWTLDGKYDKYNCIDIDPYTIYEKGIEVEDPLAHIA